MATIIKQTSKKSATTKKSVRTKMPLKRKQAIEKAISFWKKHAIDLSDFKFNRDEANER